MNQRPFPNEPLSVVEEGAAAMHEMLLALVGAGFTEVQAAAADQLAVWSRS